MWFWLFYFVRGARLFGLPANLAFSLISFPHPPDPLPGGKGETKVIFMQGASPLATPGLSGTRHWFDLPVRQFGGGLLSCLPANPAFSLIFCPLSPRSPSPAGKGENHSFLMQGASPLATSRLNPRGTASGSAPGTPVPAPEAARVFRAGCSAGRGLTPTFLLLPPQSSKGILMPRAERREQNSRTRAGR